MTQIQSILLADDDPDDRFLFEEALAVADDSIQLQTAVDGVDALEKLHAGIGLPDVIFMDVNMPRMNGIDCLRELSGSTFRSIPVIMYSTSSHYKKECFENGAIDYIEKPSDFEQLCTKLKSVLRQGLPNAKNPDKL
jgi:CheY-like chemotaxis protein